MEVFEEDVGDGHFEMWCRKWTNAGLKPTKVCVDAGAGVVGYVDTVNSVFTKSRDMEAERFDVCVSKTEELWNCFGGGKRLGEGWWEVRVAGRVRMGGRRLLRKRLACALDV